MCYRDHTLTRMRRVIRHIVTIVTFERWAINWERASKDEARDQGQPSESYSVEVKRQFSGQHLQNGQLPGNEDDD